MKRSNYILPLLVLTILGCTRIDEQELYDDEIGEAPIIVHQAKRYIENVGLDVSLLDVCKSGSVSVMTKSHKIEGNRQLEIVSIDWRSYDIRQDHGKEVLFVPLTHADWWNGTNWCSDYKQKFYWWPGNHYKEFHPSYKIYR